MVNMTKKILYFFVTKFLGTVYILIKVPQPGFLTVAARVTGFSWQNRKYPLCLPLESYGKADENVSGNVFPDSLLCLHLEFLFMPFESMGILPYHSASPSNERLLPLQSAIGNW